MWIVIKYNKKNLGSLKRDLLSKIGNKTKFYIPKILINYQKKNKIIFKENFLLGDYLLCFHENFNNINFIETLKYSKGVKYILSDFINAQKEISNFIEKCKLNESKNGYIKQSFFDCDKKENYEFLSGPFSKMIFKVIEENKSNYKILLDNFKVTISKEDYLFKPV